MAPPRRPRKIDVDSEGEEMKPANPVDASFDDDNEAATSRIDAIVAEFAQADAYITLERYEGGEWVFADRLEFADTTAARIKDLYGGGKYRIRLVERTDEKNIQRRQVTFRIMGRAKLPEDTAAMNGKSGMDERMDRLEKLLTEPRANPADGTTEILKVVLAKMLTPERPSHDPLLGTLITALVANKNGAPGVDPIKLQELLENARNEGYTRGKELGEAVASLGNDPETSVAAVLARSLPSIAETFGKAVAQGRAHVPLGAPTVARIPAPPTPTPTPTQTTGEDVASNPNAPPWVNYLRPAAPLLLKWARAGKSAEIKAANMLDDLSDTQRELVAGAAESETFVETIIGTIPEFQALDVVDWMVRFFSAVRDELTEPESSSCTICGVDPSLGVHASDCPNRSVQGIDETPGEA